MQPTPKGVLLVEDDNVIRESLREVLVEEGYTVATAQHGKEALLRLTELRPCVILLDLMMPVMDGWQVLEHLQQDSALASIPVVVVSASREPRPLSGAVCIMRKPINLPALLEQVERHCQAAASAVNPP